MKHIHILGICGTFMGSLAMLAKAQGYRVTGCDEGVYPPMSTQLEEQGIELHEGFDSGQLALDADLYVVGNAISRGNPLLEAILDQGLPYTSGPGMLAETVLPGKWVLAASGTHGKTTTSSMLAWILEYAGMSPGFLIGGIPANFGVSARLGNTPFFVIEADEYDSAFFDKRSKFIHYRPRTLIINNLEYDHADIFPDLAAIQRQFHHLVRTVPGNGRIICPADVPAIEQVLEQGCWSEIQRFGDAPVSESANLNSGNNVAWSRLDPGEEGFSLTLGNKHVEVQWPLSGDHNIANAVAAMLAARHVGVEVDVSAQALNAFEGVKRRMELLAKIGEIHVYDDFAHHPTAIATTLEGLRRKVGDERIVALIEPRSNTMKQGVHADHLLASAKVADAVIWAELTDMPWLREQVAKAGRPHHIGQSVEALLDLVRNEIDGATHVVIMSNGGFAGIHSKLVDWLEREFA